MIVPFPTPEGPDITNNFPDVFCILDNSPDCILKNYIVNVLQIKEISVKLLYINSIYNTGRDFGREEMYKYIFQFLFGQARKN